MRSLFLVCLFTFRQLLSTAQVVIPVFTSNAAAIDTVHYRDLFPVTAGSDLTVSLMQDSYDSHYSTYHILSYKNGRWSHHIYRNNYRDDNQDPVADKHTLEELPVRQHRCNKAWDRLLDHNLLKMDAEAQKVTEKKWANNKVERFNISHGDNYEFVIRTKDQMRVIYSYSPDKFYEWMPEIKDRKYFIECRDIFLELVD